MDNKKLRIVSSAICLILGILYIVAMFDWDYGLYVFIRIFSLVALITLIVCYTMIKNTILNIVTPISALVLILFNPIFPIYLEKEAWIVLDIISGIIMLALGGYIVYPLINRIAEKKHEHNPNKTKDTYNNTSNKTSPDINTEKALAEFKKTYRKIVSTAIAKRFDYYEYVTAAYLYFLLDITMVNAGADHTQRLEIKLRISEMLDDNGVYDFKDNEIVERCVDTFARISRGEIIPRGNWCFYNYNEEHGLIIHSFICYGDLMMYPHYIDDYDSAPIILDDFFSVIARAKEFNSSIKPMIENYIDEIFNIFK